MPYLKRSPSLYRIREIYSNFYHQGGCDPPFSVRNNENTQNEIAGAVGPEQNYIFSPPV
jgi:hypothetical protein